MQASQRIAAIKRELASFPEGDPFRAWDRLQSVYRAYGMNSRRLLALLAAPEQHPELMVALMDPSPEPGRRVDYTDEFLCYLINYCATVKALVDHSRIQMRKHEKRHPRFLAEYQRRLNDLLELPVVHFVQDLRDYLLHVQLPSVTHRVSFSRQPNSTAFAVLLDTEWLLRWKKWDPPSKQYLSKGGVVNPKEAVTDYSAAIESLYVWLFSQVRNIVMEDAETKMRLQTELTRLQQGMS